MTGNADPPPSHDDTHVDPCPSREELERLAQSRTPVTALGSHLMHCQRCADTVFSIRADNALLDEFLDANRERISASDTPISAPVPPDGYEIVAELHRGAQGIVFDAIHHATKRHVALKMILHGAFATAKQRHRFERELELVAGLDHPNIVTVHDGGTAPDGRPFLVMELVHGKTLGEWIAEHDAPDIPTTLELFNGILNGMAHAHQRGVIHRDLKPDNIIIDEQGQPHILDFGLAKPTTDHTDAETIAQTAAGEFLGTFAYAAPEQVAADPSRIDTRTDIYSLGGILYESLTGARPYDLGGSLASVIDTIVNTNPVQPRQRRAAITPDLQAIILKALHKLPDDRYQSVHAFHDDIRHYLDGEPVNALRGETWYWLRTTVRRYRAAILLATSAFAIVVAFTISTWFMYLAKTREANKAYESIESLVSIIAKADPEDPDEPLPAMSVVDLLDDTSSIIVDRFADLPAPMARVRTKLGEAYIGHSKLSQAEEHLLAVLAIEQKQRRGNHPNLALALHNVVRVYWKYGRYDTAERYYRDSLTMRQALHPGNHPDVAESLHHLASTLRLAGQLDPALDMFHESIAMNRALPAEDAVYLGISLNGLGNALYDRGQYTDALLAYDDAFALIPPSASVFFARVEHRQALCHIALGDLDTARSLLEQSLETKRESRDEDHPDIADAHHGHALLHLASGNLASAEESVRAEIASRTAARLDTHPDHAYALGLLGKVLIARDQLDQANAALQQAITICKNDGLGVKCWSVADIQSAYGECLVRQGETEAGARLILEAHQSLEDALDDDAIPLRESRRRLELIDS